MKKHLFCFLFCLFAGIMYAQETLPVVIDNAYLALYKSVYRDNDFYKDRGNLTTDLPMYHIPKGTKVLVLSRTHEGTMMKVQLSDGSIGYMPTVSFIDKSDLTFTLTNSYKDIPAGKYTFIGLGKMVQRTDYNQLSVEPEYYLYRGENGCKYKIIIGSRYIDGPLYDRIRDFSHPYDADFLFSEFFKKHPAISLPEDKKVIKYELKDGRIPETYIGCSKSYIESIIGEPLSYAGPGLSQFKGYPFAYYTTVSWNSGYDRLNETGLIIYYDSELRAVHMALVPINTCRRKTTTRLLTPFSSRSEINPNIADKIRFCERKERTYIASKPCEETYTTPKTFDRIRLSSMYFLEQKLGVMPGKVFYRLKVLGILLLFLSIISSIINFTTPRIPLSHNWIRFITFTLIAPFAFFAIAYTLRFSTFTICISCFLFITSIVMTYMLVNEDINRNKCAQCQTRLDSPIVINKVRTSKIEVGKPEVTDRYVFLKRESFDQNFRGARTTGSTEYKNHYTRLTLSWRIKETLKCPICGHIWEYDGQESKEIWGPICHSTRTTSQDTRTEKVVTTTTVTHKGSGRVLGETTSNDTRSSTSSSSNIHYDYDTKRYNEYLHRYLNGDERAIKEYYDKFFGKYDGINWNK